LGTPERNRNGEAIASVSWVGWEKFLALDKVEGMSKMDWVWAIGVLMVLDQPPQTVSIIKYIWNFSSFPGHGRRLFKRVHLI
jgi:hypothetical protein